MLAIIDGDVLAYLACKSRWRNEKDQVVVVLDKDAVTFNTEDDRYYLQDSWENFKQLVAETVDLLFADDFVMAVKSDTNFRDDLYPLYKANRRKDPSKANNFVPHIRKLAVAEDLAIEATWREADDMLRIWAEQARAAGTDYVVVSVDKDLKCIPGTHYNIKKKEVFTITPEYALKFFYEQLLMGDPTDNIPGVPKIGPVKAHNFLISCNTEEEMQELVVEQYINAFGEDWYNQLLSNGKMLYLQKHEHDFFHLQDWPIAQLLAEHGAHVKERLREEVREVLALEEELDTPPELVSPPAVKPSTHFFGTLPPLKPKQ
jgi:hypothetical protein